MDNEIAVQNLMKLGGYFGLKPVSEKLTEEEFRVSYDVTGAEGGRSSERGKYRQ